MEKSEQEILKEISEIIFPLTELPVISCGIHADKKSVILCSHCSAGICGNCLSKTEDPAHLICPKCIAEENANKSFLKYLRVLKFPAIWVMLCIALAGIAYGMGVGNPDLEYMEKKDQDDPWYRKDAGTILFSQASRESQRAAALRYLNRDQEAAKWSMLAAGSFARCAKYWQQTPALPDLTVAEALMLANSGEVDQGIEILSQIKGKQTDQIYPVLQYHLGELYLKKGDENRADEYFRKAWTGRPGRGSDIDSLLFDAANNMKEAEMMSKVRIICNTKWTKEMAGSCQKRLKVENDTFDFSTSKIKKTSKEIKKMKKSESEKKPVKQQEPDFEIEMIE